MIPSRRVLLTAAVVRQRASAARRGLRTTASTLQLRSKNGFMAAEESIPGPKTNVWRYLSTTADTDDKNDKSEDEATMTKSQFVYKDPDEDGDEMDSDKGIMAEPHEIDKKMGDQSDIESDVEEGDASSTLPAAGSYPGDEIPESKPKFEQLPELENAEKLEFQAETRQLLDIVTHSLYTDKEVFLRELVSNASDSLEKLRHLQATNQIETDNIPLEIRIELDEVSSTLTISDTGLGMTKEEMISNLGTIARSGSKAFLHEIKRSEEVGSDPMSAIIGKFGVGFYSSFMVGKRVEVRSQSARSDEEPKVWVSDGYGSYEICDLPEYIRQDRGCSIVIHFKDEHWDFVDEVRIEKILKKYSNFVNFPIYLNGKRVNTLSAIWADDPRQVKEDDYTAFYKFIANAPDLPLETIHFRADAPIDIKALFFIPQFHSEKYGMERMSPGVSLYSRKVLIEANSPDILPDWLRFVKGVVDSEDLPLAISREKTQDSALLGKLRKTLSRKIVAHLEKMARKDKSKFIDDFYKEYQYFLKEGICQDIDSKEQLAKLLYFETSRPAEDNEDNVDMVSLDEYVSRMPTEQTDIYYLVAPSRESAVNSPYLEAFEKAGVEVIFCFNPIEDFVMANLEKYEGRPLTSAEKSNVDLSKIKKKDDFVDGDGENDEDRDENDDLYAGDRKLNAEESLDFCNWFKELLGDKKIGTCTVTSRLTSSPAIIVDSESGAMRRMMRMVDTSDGARDAVPLGKQNVEINPKHAIITGLYDIRKKEPTLAKVIAEQIYDDCLIAGGLLDDSRSMLPRLNDILLCVVNGAKKPLANDMKNEAAPEKEVVEAEDVKEEPVEKTKTKPRKKTPKDEILEASYEEKDAEDTDNSDGEEKTAKKTKKRATRKTKKEAE